MKRVNFSIVIAFCAILQAFASQEAVFQIEEYNSKVQDFTLKEFGLVPQGSFAFFENEYGATAGNRYNQIPRNREASLTLVGWGGCRIDSITLAMCSNNSKGSARLLVTAGDTTLFTMPTALFADSAWYGAWLSKDLTIYADITKQMTSSYVCGEDEDVVITLKGGTSEGSVYLHRVTVYYTPAPQVPMVSPLGYVYQKMEKKDVLQEGDTVILFRSGDVAADLGGMSDSHYLDAIGVDSYCNVYEYGVCHFVLHQQDAAWQLITLEGDTLGASAKQNLAWNAGLTTWNVTLTYDGVEITSTNAAYGTIRYNAPSGSYPRFWNYTSTSLPLPYLYRRLHQSQPVAATSLTLPADRMVFLSQQDTLVLKAALLPLNTTDERLRWSSSNPGVASVRDGVVTLHGCGQTTITCTTWNGALAATCEVSVLDDPEPPVEDALENLEQQATPLNSLEQGRICILPDGRMYIVRNGRKYSLLGQSLY